MTRHTFATEYLANGGTIWDLCKICGWTDTARIEKRYGHLVKGWVDKAVQAVTGIV